MTTSLDAFSKHNMVTFSRAVQNARSVAGYGNTHDFAVGDTAKITNTLKGENVVIVRTKTRDRWGRSGTHSFKVSPDVLDPNSLVPVAVKVKPKVRKLGETPEGDHIAINDPRIKWIWEDAAKIATREGYCGYYDSITDKLGIPGREREFAVRAKIAGLEITSRIKAHSQKEADALFAAKVVAGPATA